MENAEERIKTSSPPMPYLRAVHSSEHRDVQTKPDIKVKRPDQDEPQSVLCMVPKKICARSPTEKPV
ncbi:hypothetical protein F7725_022917 [Dissostichus mawsoni]|uniref:Uncharacterized protein n=1 Tax=Dissostichus mawsoni TaxID=36200 RepID=A0A7J5YZ56_DISMA|nr:hypothetical protein F7725_022917 [Dissostichus mawsoni]